MSSQPRTVVINNVLEITPIHAGGFCVFLHQPHDCFIAEQVFNNANHSETSQLLWAAASELYKQHAVISE
jgi:hypothetical protein